MMKTNLLLLTLCVLLLSCQDRQDKQVVGKSQAAEIKVEPELYEKLVAKNPTIDTASYSLLTGAGFPEKDAKFYSYGGSLVTYAEVGDTDLRTVDLTFADAYLNGDTLDIYIKPTSSLSELLSGWGIAVTVVGNRINTNYYEWSDINIDGTKVEAEYDRLTLNTDKYAKGDTIAGKLFYRSKGNFRYASGYFRAIIN